jgi:hypothetical protein
MPSVWVTNTTDEALEDGWAGNRYRFSPNQSLEVPHEAAQHIFGWEIEDKVPFLSRLGWVKTSNDVPNGMKRLDAFKISAEPPEQKSSGRMKLVK